MKKKIVFLTSQVIDARNYQRFDIDLFLKKDWDVKILYFKKDNFTNKKAYKNTNKNFKIITVKKNKEIFNFLKNNKNFIYIDIMRHSIKSIFLNIFLCMRKNLRITLIHSPLPIPHMKKDFYYFFKIFFNLVLLKDYIIINTHKYLDKIIFTNNTYSFFSGTEGLKLTSAKKKIPIHSFDYDFFIKDSNKISNNKKKNIVFIDQYEDNHPDYKSMNISTVSKKKYYRSLNNFFNNIESKTKKKVVIAAHPRAPNSRTFGKRKIYYNKTYKLIKESYLCLTHDSAAINFAIAHEKPLLFFYTNEIVKKRYVMVSQIKAMSRELGIESINIDQDLNKINYLKYLKIKKSRYQKYFYKYISTNKNGKITVMKILEKNLSKLNIFN